MDVLRVQRGTTRSIKFALQVDGALVDADGAMSVTVTNDEGAGLLAVAASHEALGMYSVLLTPAETATLDFLTLAWTATVSGVAYTAMSTVEVVGGFWFSVPQIRAAFVELAAYTDARIQAARTDAELFLEEQTDWSAVARYRRESIAFHRRDTYHAVLGRWPVLRVRSVTLNGVALSSDDLATVTVDPDGVLFFERQTLLSAWSLTRSRVLADVSYEYGPRVVSASAARVAMILARHRLLRGPLDDRRIGLPVEGGGVVALLTPGVKGSVTGIPEVDQWLLDHPRERSVA